MKRAYKFFLIAILSIALLCAAALVGASAADSNELEFSILILDGNGTPVDVASDLFEAFDKASQNSTLCILTDLYLDEIPEGYAVDDDGYIALDKSLHFVLEGAFTEDFTFSSRIVFTQENIKGIKTVRNEDEIIPCLTFENGRIEGHGNQPLFVAEDVLDLNLYNVDTYSAALVATNHTCILDVEGGEHHVLRTAADGAAWCDVVGGASISFDAYAGATDGEGIAKILVYKDGSPVFSFREGSGDVTNATLDISNAVVMALDFDPASDGDYNRPDPYSTVNLEKNFVSNVHKQTQITLSSTVFRMSIMPTVANAESENMTIVRFGPNTSLVDLFDISKITATDMNEMFMQVIAQLSVYINVNIIGYTTNAEVAILVDDEGNPATYLIPANTVDVTVDAEGNVSYVTDANGYVTWENNNLAKYSFIGTKLKTAVEIYDVEGNILETRYVVEGEPIYIDPGLTRASGENGFYKWETTGSYIDDAGTVMGELYAVGEIMRIYPEITVTPYLRAAKYNLGIFTHISVNVLIPTDIPDGCEIVSVGELSAPTESAYDADGTEYASYTIANTLPARINELYSTTVVMRVTNPLIAGGSMEITQNIRNLSAETYLENLIKDSDLVASGTNLFSGECNRMAADLYRYCFVATTMSVPRGWIEGAVYHEAIKVLNDYSHLLTTLPDDFFESLKEEAADDTAENTLSEYLNLITYNYYFDDPKILIYFNETIIDGTGKEVDLQIESVTIEIENGWVPGEFKEEGEGTNWGKTIYTSDESWETTYWDFSHITTAMPTDDGRYIKASYLCMPLGSEIVYYEPSLVTSDIASIMVGNIPFYNIDKEMTIKVHLKGGEVVSGTYSMAAYYAHMQKLYDAHIANGESEPNGGFIDLHLVEMAEIKNYVSAVYACSQSLAAYRFSEKVTND